MAINLTLPELGGKGSSTKDMIISILSHEWPLSLKQIHNEIEKNHKSVSYQAVHKALNEMVAEKVLEKNGIEYKLSWDWIQRVEAFSKELRDSYLNNNERLFVGDSRAFSLKTFYEVDVFLVKFLEQEMQGVKGKPIAVLHWHHFWVPLFLNKEEYSKIKLFASLVDLYSVCRGSTPIDKWCADFWIKRGVHVKTGADVAATTDLAIFKDFVIQIFYPTEIKKLIHKAFSSAKKVSDIDLDAFFKTVFEKKTRIPVVVLRNAELARQLKKQTVELFK